MSIGVNFYKSVELIKHEGIGMFDYDRCELKYEDNHDTSWSAGNIIKLGNLFEKYTSKNLPITLFEYHDDCLDDLIEPKDMVKYCDMVLQHKEDKLVIRFEDRLNYIKNMSSKGYYVSYDSE